MASFGQPLEKVAEALRHAHITESKKTALNNPQSSQPHSAAMQREPYNPDHGRAWYSRDGDKLRPHLSMPYRLYQELLDALDFQETMRFRERQIEYSNKTWQNGLEVLDKEIPELENKLRGSVAQDENSDIEKSNVGRAESVQASAIVTPEQQQPVGDSKKKAVQEPAIRPSATPGTNNSPPTPIDPCDLLNRYTFFHNVLLRAEHTLEHRHTRFDQELREFSQRRQLFLQRKRGPLSETSTELEYRHLRETQKMTRDIVDAEEQLQEAKDMLREAGMQPPGNDVESGFLDREDDGYCLSGERRPEEYPGILEWVASNHDESPPAEGPASEPDIDLWDGPEPGIWESRSLFAEGRGKKKIEAWRARAEGALPFAVPERRSSRKWEKVVGVAKQKISRSRRRYRFMSRV